MATSERKPVKTRKAHWCSYCGDTIKAGADGTVCESGFGPYGPFRAYACSRCVPYIDEFWKWCGGECENTEAYCWGSWFGRRSHGRDKMALLVFVAIRL